MKQESFKVLEYKRILSRLAEKAGTKLGKELALGLLPVSESEDVKERLRRLLRRFTYLPQLILLWVALRIFGRVSKKLA